MGGENFGSICTRLSTGVTQAKWVVAAGFYFYFTITFFKNPGEINHHVKLTRAAENIPQVTLLLSSSETFSSP